MTSVAHLTGVPFQGVQLGLNFPLGKRLCRFNRGNIAYNTRSIGCFPSAFSEQLTTSNEYPVTEQRLNFLELRFHLEQLDHLMNKSFD